MTDSPKNDGEVSIPGGEFIQRPAVSREDQDAMDEFDREMEALAAEFDAMRGHSCGEMAAFKHSDAYCTIEEISRGMVAVVGESEVVREFATGPFIRAVREVMQEARFARSEISVALVNDTRIHELNRQFLNHDYPTDVITFPLGDEDGCFHGEIVVSVDTAKATAARLGWPAEHELLLYVIHGALHLAGYDDQDPESLAAMRAAERRHLACFGLTPPVDPLDA